MNRQKNSLWKALRLFLFLALITGIIYPLIITGLALLTMPIRAGGNLVYHQGKIVGSQLIAQKFEGNGYFWPRPSAIDYQPLPSGASNLGPTSAKLKNLIDSRKSILVKANQVDESLIPSECLYASGSGIDPHISLHSAYFQIERIIKARKLAPEQGRKMLERLINHLTIKRRFGLLGIPCVNVLLLNISLDLETKNEKRADHE